MERLKKGTEFARVIREGRNVSNAWAVLYTLRREQGGLRAGVAAGKRLGKAHVRNRAKRLLREALRRLAPRATDGADLVVIARRRTAEGTLEGVERGVRELLERCGLSTQRP